jgi:Mg2+ and Co2+ transporter CorA
MNSVAKVPTKRILNLLESISKDLDKLKKKKDLVDKKTNLKQLEKYRVLLDKYRRFVSPRKVVGGLIDKAKNKFYYETEHFVGDIFAHQEQFNTRVVEYLERLEKELSDLKKEVRKKKK